MKGISGYTGILKLAGLIIVLPLFVYSWEIRRTVELNRTVREQAVRIETTAADTIRRSPPSVLSAKQDSDEGDAIKTGTILHRMASCLEQYGVTVVRYTPYCLHREGGSELYAGELLLSGRFISLTSLLDELEKQGDGRIVSVGHRTAVLPQTRKKQLQMTVIFQQITPNDKP